MLDLKVLMRFKKILPFALRMTAPLQRYPVKANEDSKGSIVQLVGSGRNGSTLIGTILNQHSKLVVVPEQFFFHTSFLRYKLYGLMPWRWLVKKILSEAQKPIKTVGWNTNFSASWYSLMALPTEDRSFRSIMDSTYSAYADSTGKDGPIVDKTPLNAQTIEELLQVYPDVKYIFLNRDGRAVVNSYMRGTKEVFQEMNGLERSARFWNECIEAWDAVKAVVPEHRRFEISYERLVTDTESLLRELCLFLEVDFEAGLMAHHQNADKMGVDAMAHHQNLKRPIGAQSIHKWKTQLTAEQVRLIESIIGPNLERCGYQLTPSS